ncbi:MAG: hypothetical protein WEA10_10970 [Actinomycetota bacterium]
MLLRRLFIPLCALLVTSGALAAPPAVADWSDPACEIDGSPLAGSDGCVPGADATDPASGPNSCAGASICEQTYAQLRGTVFDDSDVRTEDDRALSELPVVPARRLRGGGISYGGWVSFHLYRDKHCAGTIKDNNFCGWLFHKYRAIDSSGPRPGIQVTAFPARSGNNRPASKWVRNLGPVPNRFTASAGGRARTSFRWGRMNGSYTGFERDGTGSFYPGKWRLDPWVIHQPSKPSHTRSSFEIHGGRNGDGSSRFWTTRTAGCIRLTIKGIRGLRAKWSHRTDNRRRAEVYVVHHA